ncbi:amino acid racemase [Pseudomonas sp. CG7]|uniref:aspartate/glutamate racemase family protein n=1 Tax=Pseudomonas sp. CG7 TaxID=191007 RepID=UPI0020348023|nr:amino acid racemase [Pseudomonas sp. CG7]MCM2459423.1 amino acid racemase [Pseudomonas sp. CG7]
MSNKIVGVIGGMGPEATVDLMGKVISLTPAKDDSDHIRMLVDCNPQIPSRIKALVEKTGDSPAATMINMAKSLEAFGADFLVIPCNTAHYYHAEVAGAIDIPVLNMLEVTVEHILEKHTSAQKVGVLASTAVIQLKLYEKILVRHAVEVLAPAPAEQKKIMDSIRQIKAGVKTSLVLKPLMDAISFYEAQGADCIVIACTEISVVAADLKSNVSLYDASYLLATKIVSVAKT